MHVDHWKSWYRKCLNKSLRNPSTQLELVRHGRARAGSPSLISYGEGRRCVSIVEAIQSALERAQECFASVAVAFDVNRHALQDAPVADAKPDDIKDLLGGALFKALFKWMEESGPIYLLPTGPVSSFLVISDPDAAKHVLQRSDNPKNNVYGKGLVAEVSEFLFGIGFATSGVPPLYVLRCELAKSNAASCSACHRKLPLTAFTCFWVTVLASYSLLHSASRVPVIRQQERLSCTRYT